MTAAASFNGGRSQTGLNVLQTGGEYPFLNVVKTCQNWAYQSNPNANGDLDPALLDENGYPTSIQTGGYYSVCYVPLSWVGQSLTVQWDGGGTIRVPGTSPIGSTTSSNGSTNNSITCTCADQRILVGATATSASPNHIKNIRVSLTGSETTLLNAGGVFSTAFKNKLIEAGFGVLRFMDWQANNTTTMIDWASRKPVDYYSYAATEFRNTASTGRPKLVCGVTGGSGNNYTITGNGDGVPASGGPTHMQVIQLNFHADATESGGATLNLNGAGAKAILAWWGDALSPGANSYPKAFYNGTSIPMYGTLIFDSALDGWLLYGADYAFNVQGHRNGVPPEICLQLAAEVGAHPWFVAPRFALEAATDYIPQLAAYCRDNAPSWMIPRFEGPNETFNTGNAGFHNGIYGRNKANAVWGTSNQFWRYGYWQSILGQAVATAYGIAQANTKTQTRYQLICGVQTYGTPANLDQELSSAAYIAQAGAAPAGYSKAAGVAEAWRWTTHIAVAQYWAPSQYGSSVETDAVTAYQTADAITQVALLDSYANSSITSTSGGSTFTQPAAITQYGLWKTWAQSFSVNKMCGYEGGYSPDYIGSLSANANVFRNNVKARASTALYLQAIFQGFIGLSDDTFTVEFPSTFLITDFTYDNPTTYVWTLLKGDLESANTPMFDFIVRFNKGRRAISPRLRVHG